jgi:hypothetical protein
LGFVVLALTLFYGHSSGFFNHFETRNMTALSILNSCIASSLDAVAVLTSKVLPIAGAGVTYTKGLSFRIDAWKEGNSRVLQLGGFEACVDLKE